MTDTVSRTVRFKEDEVRLIEEFLEKNPFFDFSSLTRIAVTEFVKKPSVQIMPIQSKSSSRTSRAKNLEN